MDFFYDLPNWQLGILTVGSIVAFTLIGFIVARRIHNPEITGDELAVLLSVVAIIATIQSLLLAFSAVSVWESFSDAETAVVEEANTVGKMSRDLAVFGSTESTYARSMLRNYVTVVIEDEWPEMSHGRGSQKAWDAFDTLFRTVGTMKPDNPQRVALMPEIWGRMNELVELRRERLGSAQSEIPPTLWSVVVLGSILTLSIAYFLPKTRFSLAMLTAFAGSMGLVFFFLIAMDRPFAGQENVSAAPFESALENMNRWDTVTE